MPNQERLRETKHHGAVRFPFNIYPCTIPGVFLQVPLHWHDSMELVYVKKGSGIVQVGVNAYPAEQGDIYIFWRFLPCWLPPLPAGRPPPGGSPPRRG